jgi:hypothetical protein
MKKEIEEYGGTEGSLRWVRSNEDAKEARETSVGRR